MAVARCLISDLRSGFLVVHMVVVLGSGGFFGGALHRLWFGTGGLAGFSVRRRTSFGEDTQPDPLPAYRERRKEVLGQEIVTAFGYRVRGRGHWRWDRSYPHRWRLRVGRSHLRRFYHRSWQRRGRCWSLRRRLWNRYWRGRGRLHRSLRSGNRP